MGRAVKRCVHRVRLPGGIVVTRTEREYRFNHAVITLFAGKPQVTWHETKKSARETLNKAQGWAVLEPVSHG